MTAAHNFRVAHVGVPATCANLGPGFDTLGIALSLRDEITARTTDEGVTVRIIGEGEDELPLDAEHLVVRAMYAAFDLLGEKRPGLEINCLNRIPQARGLGSSSGAIVAGILLARQLVTDGTDRLGNERVLRLAAELEGHPDNVAPCLLGGFTIAWVESDGACAVRLDPHPSVRPVVFIPEERSFTSSARAVLPEMVPHRDAAINTGRAALLVHAVTQAPEHLLAATYDRLHQGYRAAGMPDTAALVEKIRAEGVPAVMSGAGPSVLALGHEGWVPSASSHWRILPLAIDGAGAKASDLPGTLRHAEQDAVVAGPAS